MKVRIEIAQSDFNGSCIRSHYILFTLCTNSTKYLVVRIKSKFFLSRGARLVPVQSGRSVFRWLAYKNITEKEFRKEHKAEKRLLRVLNATLVFLLMEIQIRQLQFNKKSRFRFFALRFPGFSTTNSRSGTLAMRATR